jgi:transposase InsO family protein
MTTSISVCPLCHPHSPRTVNALIDSGAEENFISQSLVVEMGMHAQRDSLGVHTIDGHTVRVYGRHTSRITAVDSHGVSRSTDQTFLASDIRRYDLILGWPWLEDVEPDCRYKQRKWFYRDKDPDDILIQEVTRQQFAKEAREAPYVFMACCVPVPSELNAGAALYATTESEPQLPSCYRDFEDVFAEPPSGVSDAVRTVHAIDLEEGAEVPYGPIYPLSEKELRVLREYLHDSMAKGWIKKSISPAGAPILFVPKKDGTLRLCVDYRALNKLTVKNRHPLPLINETIDRLANAKIFTKLDLRDAYHRIRIKLGDEWKTAFRTRYGHYEYLVMPFGLTNAPATFQAYINEALGDLLDITCVAYLDDILIYSDNVEEHEGHVRQVLERLRKYGLFAKLSKCEFSVTEVEFLGYIIGTAGVSMDPRRVATIREWKEPQSYREIQVFLGFANFYRRFVHRYSSVVVPMTDLLKGMQKGKKSGPFHWPKEASDAFRKLQDCFTKAPMLQHYNPLCRLRMETDASGFGLAAILSQLIQLADRMDSAWHPIAFWSRKQSGAERNYETHDQELLAVVEAFQEWRQYLEGAQHTIEVLCDHNNLKYFMTTKALTRRQARWAERLAAFDFDIIYRKGETNPADGPSRRPDYEEEDESSVQSHQLLLPTMQQKLRWNEAAADHSRLAGDTLGGEATVSVLTRSQTSDQGSSQGRGRPPNKGKAPQSAAADRRSASIAPATSNTEAEYFGGEEAKGLAFMKSRKDVAKAAEGMSPYQDTPGTFTNYLLDLQGRDAWCLMKEWEGLPNSEILKGPMRGRWRVDREGLVRCDGGVYVPYDPATRAEILRMNHDDPWLGGHFGAKRTVHTVTRHYWWPAMKHDVRRHVASCDTCQRMKSPRHKPYGLLAPLPQPDHPWQDIAMDFITGFPPAGRRGKAYDAILVVVDRFSKMARFIACTKDIDAVEMAERLTEDIISKLGMPRSTVTDRGSLFTSKYWETFCRCLNTKRKLSTSYHPQTDGQTERQNQTLEAYIRCYVNHQQDDWIKLLPGAEYAYNDSVHASTGMTPFEMCYKWKPELRFNPLVEDNVAEGEAPEARRLAAGYTLKTHKEIWERSKAAAEKYYNAKHKDRSYRVGDQVLVSSQHIRLRKPAKKLTDRFLGPFEVLKTQGLNAYVLDLPKVYQKLHATFHVSLLEPYVAREGEEPPPPVSPEDEDVWEVERIEDERVAQEKRMFLIKWMGYPKSQNTWEPEENLVGVGELLEEFYKERELGAHAQRLITERKATKKKGKRKDSST